MFSVREFFSQPYAIAHVDQRIGNETFRIRPFNGKERLEYNALQGAKERTFYALSRCLIDGESNRPIGEYSAENLVERNGTLADRILAAIITVTNDLCTEEERLWGDAEKNLPATDGSGGIAPGVDDTI
ncbi:MAG: hypothetical protein Q4C47_06630 [Planctomycetia bacterium]|nr:hypothetical protein [Planctomycetia bacterium]